MESPWYSAGPWPVESIRYSNGPWPVEQIRYSTGPWPVESVRYSNGPWPVESIRYSSGPWPVEQIRYSTGPPTSPGSFQLSAFSPSPWSRGPVLRFQLSAFRTPTCPFSGPISAFCFLFSAFLRTSTCPFSGPISVFCFLLSTFLLLSPPRRRRQCSRGQWTCGRISDLRPPSSVLCPQLSTLNPQLSTSFGFRHHGHPG